MEQCKKNLHEILPHRVFRNDWFLRHLFDHLPFDDLKNCRLVSKHWRDISAPLFNSKSVVWFGFGDRNEHLNTLLTGFEEFQMSPGGFSHTAFHFCCNTPFPWTESLAMNFFRRNGKNIKFLHVGMGSPRECKSQPKSAMSDFITFLNILFEFAPGIEKLTLYWEFFGREGVCAVDLKKNFPDRNLEGELKSLASLSLETDISRGMCKTKGKLKSVLSEAISAVLTKAPKVEKILITNAFLLNSVSNLDTFIVTVKEIDLVVWNDVDDLTIDAVVALGEKGIRLSYFSILFKENSKRFYSTLIHFLNTQKSCLKKLSVCLQNFEKCGSEKLPRFPKMETLEKLHISSFAEMSFGNSDWISQFPVLRSLEYSYTNKREPFGIPYVNFLNDISLVSENVTFIKVNANTPFANFSGRHMNFSDCTQLFYISKQKFPNLARINLCDSGNAGEIVSILYNGVVDNSIVLKS